jgi:tRNA nucleotidyltransferase (CCA-adding enzyme)
MSADPAALRATFYADLPITLAALVREAATHARRQGAPLYLVGGAVRDLLLGRPPLDIDLVLPGDAPRLARALAATHALRMTQHGAFGTATLELTPDLAPPPPAKPALDFITARRERYPAPGQLPEVTPAGMDADLARRDFTIHAMALPLEPDGGPLLDPHGGQADLAAGVIRALHAGSFRDDPTRIFRAARYAARFGFTVEPQTAGWIAAALAAGMMDRLSPARIRQELLRTLAEPAPLGASQEAPAPALDRLNRMGALGAVDPAFTWDAAWAADFVCTDDPAGRLLLLLDRQPPAARTRIATRLGVEPRPLEELAALAGQQADLVGASPAAVAARLRPYDPANLALYRCRAPAPVAAVIDRYLETWRHVRPLLTGDDLRALGIPPGPRYRAILAALRDARLDGRVQSRDDEIALVRALIT